MLYSYSLPTFIDFTQLQHSSGNYFFSFLVFDDPPSGILSASSRECRASMEISESDIYVIRYFRGTNWISSWILVLGSGNYKNMNAVE